tara:strand:- start:92 stop:271 length:180 start_codon:yes stop_codon:yes gene_type:complete
MIKQKERSKSFSSLRSLRNEKIPYGIKTKNRGNVIHNKNFMNRSKPRNVFDSDFQIKDS